MTIDQEGVNSFEDSQKVCVLLLQLIDPYLLTRYLIQTVYMLKRRSTHLEDHDKVPMVRLVNGKEELPYVETRLVMFQKFWASKEKKINEILANKNNDLFQDIFKYLIQPNQKSKFKSVLLMMGQNLSNHTLTINNMVAYMTKIDHFKIVRLSSKDCLTLKSAIVSLIRQILDSREDPDSAEQDPEDDDLTGNHLYYDFDAIVDWFEREQLHQILIIFEDSELIDSNVFTKLIQIIQNSSVSENFKLVFGLSSSLEAFEENTPLSIIESIEGKLVNLNNSRDVIIEMTDNILFTLDIENNEDFLFILGPSLLNELSKYDNNELMFIDTLKYCYSIYFFSNPLSILNLVSIDEEETGEEFEIDHSLIDLLRRTTSFQARVEDLKRHKQRDEIIALFENDDKLSTEFKFHYRAFYTLGLRFNKLLEMFIVLQIIFRGYVTQSKYQTYSNFLQQKAEFYDSSFYQELLGLVSKNDSVQKFDSFLETLDESSFISLDELEKKSGSQLLNTKKSTPAYGKKLAQLLDLEIKSFFKEFDNCAYKEIFTVDIQTRNSQTIIAAAFSPFIRSSVESALNDPNSYLFKSMGNSAQDELAKLMEPIISEIFTLYRELNIFINIHDFFIAFKESIQREKLVSILIQILSQQIDDDPELELVFKDLLTLQEPNLTSEQEIVWEKIVLSWFLQLMSELELIGFIKEAKKKSEAVEKLVWKGI